VLKRTSVALLITLGLVLAAGSVGIVDAGRVFVAAAQGQPPLPDGPRFIVTYVEVAPGSEAQALTLLKGYRDTTRKDEGNLKVELAQRDSRAGHFVIMEQWRDDAAWKNHRQTGHTTHFQDMLRGLRVSPYDERTHGSLAVGSGASVPAGAVLVVTHVDVIPPGQVQLREMLKTLADASRKEAGHLRFDVLQGIRQNHFTVLEAWRDQRALDAHVTAAHTKMFRDTLGPLAADGAPYDERLYRLIP
jgi:quinol monooxygenase YgiN